MFSGGLNEIMGTQDDDMHQKTFNGAEFKDGVILSISSTLQLELNCDEADTKNMHTRENTATKEITFDSGNYTCGKDFDPGEYVITAISGSGNVSSDNMFSGGLNEIMAAKDDDMYISKYSNAKFEDGTVLKVSGVKIQLSPSK